MYAIPLNGERVLRIIPNETVSEDGLQEEEVTVETIGESVRGMSKWEGCAVAPNGVAYAMPNNCKGILKIIPACIGTRD